MRRVNRIYMFFIIYFLPRSCTLTPIAHNQRLDIINKTTTKDGAFHVVQYKNCFSVSKFQNGVEANEMFSQLVKD